MKICFFNRSYWPDFGATGQLLTELAEDLVSRHGCEVSVVAGLPLTAANGAIRGPALVSRETRNGVEIFRAPGTTFRPRRFAGRAANYLTYFLSAAVAGLRVPRPDVVVSLTDPPIIGLAALAAARRAGARFVFLSEDVFPNVAALVEDFHSDVINATLERVNRRLARSADRIVVLGERMKRRLIEEKGADPGKIEIIHNWADCSAIVPGSKDSPFSREHGLENAFVVMHSGNVGLSQNLDTLLDAAECLREYPDIIVVIVGDGARRQRLVEEARRRGLANVRFLPYQPKDRLLESFAAADVFVVSLKRGLEGYIVPSKLYGILAAGRPFIAAVDPTCEAAAIARERDCGLVAEPGDARALAERVLELYRDRSLARRLGEHARAAGLAFDRRRQVQAYFDLFTRLDGAAP